MDRNKILLAGAAVIVVGLVAYKMQASHATVI